MLDSANFDDTPVRPPGRRDEAGPAEFVGIAATVAPASPRGGGADEVGTGSASHPGGDARGQTMPQAVRQSVHESVKILVAGAFGVGKTTLIGSVSEITPLRTEEVMTAASTGVDDLAGLEDKRTTTVAMDFGRITVSDEMVLYLFGTPGQPRFWWLWDGLAVGAVGALVLVDTRRLEHSFGVLDMLEDHAPELPLTLAVNHFPETTPHPHEEIRSALNLPACVPIVDLDARDRPSSITALITLVEYALAITPSDPASEPSVSPSVPPQVSP